MAHESSTARHAKTIRKLEDAERHHLDKPFPARAQGTAIMQRTTWPWNHHRSKKT
jgi:hypothetical protein